MCAIIGVSGKTNHSLRATGATRLFPANIPEKLIMERTGHRSSEAVRKYERTSAAQHQQVSSIISAPSIQQQRPQQPAPDVQTSLYRLALVDFLITPI